VNTAPFLVRRQRLRVEEDGVEMGVPDAEGQARVAIGEMQIDPLPPGGPRVLEKPETIDIGGQEEDVVVGVSPVGAGRHWKSQAGGRI
jgi:hypothetical protein